MACRTLKQKIADSQVEQEDICHSSHPLVYQKRQLGGYGFRLLNLGKMGEGEARKAKPELKSLVKCHGIPG
ncbi:hypothetical protein CEXT_278741 [Caerostris extrusa]|uniref:Uncharacterized protein n=1 Tax=Caerostris extrusa TaxID=172846 RepID=A0AAV4XSL5_CAEEX|nr:hypothetical protein CEXT_278741 [Caerostris extrusa]